MYPYALFTTSTTEMKKIGRFSGLKELILYVGSRLSPWPDLCILMNFLFGEALYQQSAISFKIQGW